MQLDQGEKGFSFMREGPLDMRMDPKTRLTAEEIINRWTEKKLGEIFRDLGEDPRWRRAAKAIVEARRQAPIRSTTELAGILSQALGSKIRGRLHPATLVFQALRICVNDELSSIKGGLSKAIERLAPAGRIGTICFQRLEERVVKDLFKLAVASKRGFHLVNKKPLEPTIKESRTNPRSRSAKMRFLEREDE